MVYHLFILIKCYLMNEQRMCYGNLPCVSLISHANKNGMPHSLK